MDIFEEFFQIVEALTNADIPYAVVGGIALSFYTEPRYTKDIDFLFMAEDLESSKAIFHNIGYEHEATPWKFSKTEIELHRLTKIEGNDFLSVDLLIGFGAEHQQMLQNAIEETTDRGIVRVIAKQDLINMKKIRNSLQDQADIEALKNDKD